MPQKRFALALLFCSVMLLPAARAAAQTPPAATVLPGDLVRAAAPGPQQSPQIARGGDKSRPNPPQFVPPKV